MATFGEDHRLHGHNYRLEVSLSGEVDPETGFLADLGLIKALVEEQVIDQLDHSHIEADIPWFKDHQPSSENLVRFIWDQIQPRMPEDVNLVRVRLFETPSIYVEFDGRISDTTSGGAL